MGRTKYRFLHRGDDGYYYWQSVRPVDSRYGVIRCRVDWFWNPR